MKSRSAKFDRNRAFLRNVGRLIGISPCGCTPMLLSCDCHAESCKCEAEIEVCRFETCPGFIDSDDPREEARAESVRAWSPWLIDEMLDHHAAWKRSDEIGFDERMAELLRILDRATYADRPHDSVSVSMLSWRPKIDAMQERLHAGLSPIDAPRTLVVDYKAAETMSHHRNGRGVCHTGAIGKVDAVLPPIALNPFDYQSVRSARLEHARRP